MPSRTTSKRRSPPASQRRTTKGATTGMEKNPMKEKEANWLSARRNSLGRYGRLRLPMMKRLRWSALGPATDVNEAT
jgi:hypothetical protein